MARRYSARRQDHAAARRAGPGRHHSVRALRAAAWPRRRQGRARSAAGTDSSDGAARRRRQRSSRAASRRRRSTCIVRSAACRWRCKTEPASVPAQIPYLSADDAALAKWSARIGALARPRIALAWSGNATHDNDRNRSLPFARLAPLSPVRSGHAIDGKGARFVSIQRDVRGDDAPALAAESRMMHVGGELAEFRRHRGRDGAGRSRHLRRHRGRAPCRRDGPAGLGADAVRTGLALDAQSARQARGIRPRACFASRRSATGTA